MHVIMSVSRIPAESAAIISLQKVTYIPGPGCHNLWALEWADLVISNVADQPHAHMPEKSWYSINRALG